MVPLQNCMEGSLFAKPMGENNKTATTFNRWGHAKKLQRKGTSPNEKFTAIIEQPNNQLKYTIIQKKIIQHH